VLELGSTYVNLLVVNKFIIKRFIRKKEQHPFLDEAEQTLVKFITQHQDKKKQSDVKEGGERERERATIYYSLTLTSLEIPPWSNLVL